MNLLTRLRRTKTAAVLGCGPAGLFAAHALAEKGWDVLIFSNKRRSEMFGAQYLHAPIPGLRSHSEQIRYELRGTTDDYRRKVYGDRELQVSPEALDPVHPAWDIRLAYGDAWNKYVGLIGNATVTPRWMVGLMDQGFDRVLSSIPLPKICCNPEDHRFISEKVWAIGDAPERGIFCPISTRDNTVILDGTPDTGWYRSANVFGYQTAEWPGRRKPPLSGVAEVTKPISNTCDCWPSVIRIGRYGTWTKGELTHHAYEKASKL